MSNRALPRFATGTVYTTTRTSRYVYKPTRASRYIYVKCIYTRVECVQHSPECVSLLVDGPVSSQFENNYLAEMCSGSETGSYLRLIDFVYRTTLGLRAITKKEEGLGTAATSMPRYLRDSVAGILERDSVAGAPAGCGGPLSWCGVLSRRMYLLIRFRNTCAIL